MVFRFRSNVFTRCVLGLSCVLITHLACSATTGERQIASDKPQIVDTGSKDGGTDDASTDADADTDDDLTFETGVPTEEVDSCAQIGSEAEPVQLDVIVLLDRSGSMYGPNWNGATLALKQFVQDPAADGIRVGILYFPIDAPSDGVVCNAAHYQNLAVPLGPLPQHAAELVQSIDGQLPNGGSTPMYGALEGTLWAAAQEQIAQPNHKVIVVFASDGDPNSCPQQQNTISIIAGLINATYAANAIETYVIAIAGASIMNLDQLANAGGTGQAYDVTANIDQFAQKMSEIRARALACEYIIPEPPANEPFELDKVVVKYVAGDGAQIEIPRADDEADCGQSPGWYFDDPVQPQKIELCPASCQLAQSDKQGRVNVFFGCKPKLN
jgi:Mg-chelatase subunit ChlD